MVRRARTMSPLALRSSSHALPGIAAGIEAERIFRADVVMLIFEAEEHVDQRALVDHVVEAAAGIPAVVARLAVESGKIGLVAETGDSRASRGLEIGRSIATGRKDHETIPGVAQSRAHREQVGDLVLRRRCWRAWYTIPLVLRHSSKHPLSAASAPRTQAPHCHCAPAWKPKMPLLGLVEKLFVTSRSGASRLAKV